MNFICEYCGSKLSSKSNLQVHQKTAKKCLNKRGVKCTDLRECICGKDFTSKKQYIKHICICVDFVENKYKKIIKSLELKNNKLEEEVKSLKNAININSNNNSNNNINNNIVFNLNVPLDLSKENISELCSKYLEEKHIRNGHNGLVNFFLQHIGKDEDGKLKLKCTDLNRKIFKYMKDDGNLCKDPKGSKLKDKLYKGGNRIISEKIDNSIEKLDSDSVFYEKVRNLYESTKDYDKFIAQLAIKVHEKSAEIENEKPKVPINKEIPEEFTLSVFLDSEHDENNE